MLVRSLPSTDPLSYARRLRGRPHLAILDSAMRHGTLGRYSFVACDPFALFEVRDGRAFWNREVLAGAPMDELRARLALYRQETRPDLPPFQGGALGCIAYEFGSTLEDVPRLHEDGDVPELVLGFYDAAIAIDHAQDRAWLISTGWPEEEAAKRAARAERRADELTRWLEVGDAGRAGIEQPQSSPAWRSNFDRPDYEAAVGRVRELILDGDLFQANIAQRFRAACGDGFDPFGFYERLRRANPAPFAAFLDFGEFAVASTSPERFLALRGRAVETRPIKGTAPRDSDPVRDAEARAKLLASEKDRAENIMIVDLLRNDLSRVCGPHSVEVPVLCGLESYPAVHHLVSVITGELSLHRDALDLLGACFPGGSVTGAPKIRAMEIIAALERVPRGIYCGAIGYIGFDGAMDTNIAIRTVTFRNSMASLHAGGGITLLSDPADEYEETLAKVGRILAAFEAAHRGTTA